MNSHQRQKYNDSISESILWKADNLMRDEWDTQFRVIKQLGTGQFSTSNAIENYYRHYFMAFPPYQHIFCLW